MEILKLLVCLVLFVPFMDGADLNTKLICAAILLAGFIAHDN